MAPGRIIIFELEHGVRVISQRVQRGRVYWRLEPHWLFPRATVTKGVFVDAIEMQRSRVIMSVHLGRPLEYNEIVHHIDHDKKNDDVSNLQIITPKEHNQHHKLGTTHSEFTKDQISRSLKMTYKYGDRSKTRIVERDSKGRIVNNALVP